MQPASVSLSLFLYNYIKGAWKRLCSLRLTMMETLAPFRYLSVFFSNKCRRNYEVGLEANIPKKKKSESKQFIIFQEHECYIYIYIYIGRDTDRQASRQWEIYVIFYSFTFLLYYLFLHPNLYLTFFCWLLRRISIPSRESDVIWHVILASTCAIY